MYRHGTMGFKGSQFILLNFLHYVNHIKAAINNNNTDIHCVLCLLKKKVIFFYIKNRV